MNLPWPALVLVLAACEEAPAHPWDLMPVVLNGTDATEARHRPVVALMAGGAQRCTGTLIRDDLVLTAAHCIPGNTDVVAGPDAATGPSFAVCAETPHPQWNPWTLANDIAMLTLCQPVPPQVRPAIPATATHPLGPALRPRLAEAVGYGTDEAGVSGRRKRADVPLDAIAPLTLVTNSAVAGVCFGDSGGPLFMETDGVLRVVGVASRVIPGAGGDCAGRAFYTRVDAYTSFLAQF